MKRRPITLVLSLASLVLGCDAAEQAKARADEAMSQAEAAEQRVAETEKQIDALDERIGAAEQRITDATKTAEDALKRADEALLAAGQPPAPVIDTLVEGEDLGPEKVCEHLLTTIGKGLDQLDTPAEQLAQSRKDCVAAIEKERTADPAKYERTARCVLESSTLEQMMACEQP